MTNYVHHKDVIPKAMQYPKSLASPFPFWDIATEQDSVMQASTELKEIPLIGALFIWVMLLITKLGLLYLYFWCTSI